MSVDELEVRYCCCKLSEGLSRLKRSVHVYNPDSHDALLRSAQLRMIATRAAPCGRDLDDGARDWLFLYAHRLPDRTHDDCPRNRLFNSTSATMAPQFRQGAGYSLWRLRAARLARLGYSALRGSVSVLRLASRIWRASLGSSAALDKINAPTIVAIVTSASSSRRRDRSSPIKLPTLSIIRRNPAVKLLLTASDERDISEPNAASAQPFPGASRCRVERYLVT
jgi:hypothetical protein